MGRESRDEGETTTRVRTESDKRRSSCFDQSEYVSGALDARIRVGRGTRESEGERAQSGSSQPAPSLPRRRSVGP